jgi:hypothetical protein
MILWEREIINAFIARYFASAPSAEEKERPPMRLRSVSLFPGFDAAPPDEKESYLEAAEALEHRGLLKLHWEKRGLGERLKTLTCEDFEKLFEEADSAYPRTEAKEIRAMIAEKIPAFKELSRNVEGKAAAGIPAFLGWYASHFGIRETGRGMSQKTVEDFIRLLELFFEPAQLEGVSARALSIKLYRDSKRLEALLELFGSALARASTSGFPPPDLAFLKRSYPETMLSGQLVFEYRIAPQESQDLQNPQDAQDPQDPPPLSNTTGRILGLPLAHAAAMRSIKTLRQKDHPLVLTIENKETFYALANMQTHGRNTSLSRYDCFLYTGGYPNQAVATVIRILAASGFSFCHAGDLDPDGILILQNIGDIAEKPVVPVLMDAAIFDRYLPWARPLAGTALRQAEKIRADTRAIPGVAELLCRIADTRRGVEQEIIDYRG